MCKALIATGELDSCVDIEDEEDPHCAMTYLCMEIINAQNHQIQTMKGILDSLGYDETDDCEVRIKTKKTRIKRKLSSKRTIKSKIKLVNGKKN